MNANFDTLDINRTLKAGGLDEPAADAITQAINKAINASVATRADLENTETKLGADIRETEARLVGRIDKLEGHVGEVQAQLNGRMDKLDGELGGQMVGLKGEMAGLKGELHILMWGLGIASSISIAMLGWLISAVLGA
jgi:hypothetical protein